MGRGTDIQTQTDIQTGREQWEWGGHNIGDHRETLQQQSHSLFQRLPYCAGTGHQWLPYRDRPPGEKEVTGEAAAHLAGTQQSNTAQLTGGGRREESKWRPCSMLLQGGAVCVL